MSKPDPVVDQLLADLLLDTNLTKPQIAEELEWTEYQVSKRIRELGLGWVKRSSRKLSRGHAALLQVMQKLAPNEEVVIEHPIGERLRLDVYCPRLKLATEYHGRQHYEYVEHFHTDYKGYEDAVKRDQRKLELCQQQGIVLVAFRYNDDLAEDAVFERLLSALAATPTVEASKQERVSLYKGNPYYEAAKQRQREWRRRQYREMKQRKQ